MSPQGRLWHTTVAVPLAVTVWKGALKSLGNVALLGGIFAAAVHFIRYGRKDKGWGA